jgi:beta-barrel assembly-enhancing protease
MNEQAPRPGPLLANRLPAEGINSSDEHPLREFAWLVGASVVTVVLLVMVVGWAARWLAPMVPFSSEVALAERLVDRPEPAAHAARSAALQELANRVATRLDMPPGMKVVVRFDDSPQLNAYATIGGRIRVFDGLLKHVNSEEALAALLAHEMSHVRRRHVASNIGRGLAVALMIGMVSSDAGAAAAEFALGHAASLALLSYSREQEMEADDDAVKAVVAMYGHAGGMIELLQRLQHEKPDGMSRLSVLETHPLVQSRIDAVQARVRDAGWPASGPATALPSALRPASAPAR